MAPDSGSKCSSGWRRWNLAFGFGDFTLSSVHGTHCHYHERTLMKLESLQKLWVHELKDLYSAESQILKALPKIIEAATNEDLKAALSEHLEQTEGQVTRLEKIFQGLGASPKGHHCKGMEGLLKEGEDILKAEAEE